MVEATLVVSNAHLWSDKDPYLYDLTVATPDDAYSLKVGIRTITVEGSRILLNGKPVKLNGFGRHEDFIASGKGLNIPLIVKDYDLMRWTGANSYRTSHYPYSEEEMQIADREGFLIIDEIPAVSLQMADEANSPERLRMCLQQIEEMIARDKNHPAVVMWCVANEPMHAGVGVGAIGESRQDIEEANLPGKRFLDTEITRARELDSTRPVTLVTVMGGPQNWMENCDVICMNRYWGWYTLGGQLDIARMLLEGELDQVWGRFHKPIIMTEFGADTIPGYHGHPSVMWTEEYQADFIRFHLEVAEVREFVAGMQVWNFADFAAVQSIARVGGLNHKGVFTRTRTPKMAAHVLREFWLKA
ncbi:MAG: Beta-glucuronidase [Chloroflexi bacterium ADurb.Bin360]|nr:MAG: Beta-glucuronidase [Chloroflexi bacterium ADurb.Bin360]